MVRVSAIGSKTTIVPVVGVGVKTREYDMSPQSPSLSGQAVNGSTTVPDRPTLYDISLN